MTTPADERPIIDPAGLPAEHRAVLARLLAKAADAIGKDAPPPESGCHRALITLTVNGDVMVAAAVPPSVKTVCKVGPVDLLVTLIDDQVGADLDEIDGCLERTLKRLTALRKTSADVDRHARIADIVAKRLPELCRGNPKLESEQTFAGRAGAAACKPSIAVTAASVVSA